MIPASLTPSSIFVLQKAQVAVDINVFYMRLLSPQFTQTSAAQADPRQQTGDGSHVVRVEEVPLEETEKTLQMCGARTSSGGSHEVRLAINSNRELVVVMVVMAVVVVK